jgi:hypothetical protein
MAARSNTCWCGPREISNLFLWNASSWSAQRAWVQRSRVLGARSVINHADLLMNFHRDVKNCRHKFFQRFGDFFTSFSLFSRAWKTFRWLAAPLVTHSRAWIRKKNISSARRLRVSQAEETHQARYREINQEFREEGRKRTSKVLSSPAAGRAWAAWASKRARALVWRFDDEIALSSATGVNFQRFRRVLKLIKLDVEMIKPVSGSDKRLQIGCECFFLLGLITYKVQYWSETFRIFRRKLENKRKNENLRRR